MPKVPGYTTREVARLLGLSEARVRGYVKSGFIEPRRGSRGGFAFSFQDLVVLRAARDLLAKSVPPRRVRRALATLRRRLPRGRSLAEVRITASGRDVVVRTGGEAWEPASGQLLLDFEVAELAAQAAPLAARVVGRLEDRGRLEAEDWYALGYELEAAAPREAGDAYRRALELDPDHPDTHLNLGRLLHEGGELAAAERHYRAAHRHRPGDATPVYNLGVALQDRGKLVEALAAYRRTIELDPDFADAYFNMAAIYEERGDIGDAIRNLHTYIRLQGLRPRLGGRPR